MLVPHAEREVKKLFEAAGMTLNGSRSFDPQVLDERVYGRLLAGGSLAAGESYMDGWWDVEDLAEFFSRILSSDMEKKLGKDLGTLAYLSAAHLFNLQSVGRAGYVAKRHYDIGNGFFEKMLGPTMTYSCGYWKDAKNLDEAETAKLDLACRKLGLMPGQKVLEIGCGWGSFAKHAAERYDVSVVGITVSKEQAEYARAHTKGLPVEIRLEDYRSLTGEFDRIVSIGMFEHVGAKNYRIYMDTANRVLKDGGLFLLHTIGGNVSGHTTDPWLHRYIFPNGMLPSSAQITQAIEGRFVLEDWHNFGPDYDTTLLAWFRNFDAAWPELKGKYDERFYRMWKYYLLSCAGAFRARETQLWQVVLSKGGVPGGYATVR